MSQNKGHLNTEKFEKKIIAFFILSLVGLLSIFVLIHKHHRSFIDTARLVEHTDIVLLQNQKVLSTAYHLALSSRAYLISGKEENLQQFHRCISNIIVEVARLKQLTIANRTQHDGAIVMEKLLLNFIEYSKQAVNSKDRTAVEHVGDTFTGLGEEMMERIEAAATRFDAQERALLITRKINNEKSIAYTSVLLITLAFSMTSLLVVGFRGFYRNSIKRDKAEEDLQKNSYFISSIINNCDNPISVRDLCGQYLLVNDQFLKYLDIDRDTVLGKHYSCFFSEDVVAKMKAIEEEVIKTRRPVLQEYQIGLKSGVYSYTSSSFPLLNENDEVYAIGSILTDITVRKKAEEALWKSNENLQRLLNRLQQLMESSLDVICIVDKEGRFKHVSSQSEKLFGYTTEEMVGRKYIELVHKDDVAKTNKASETIVSGVVYNNFENRYCKKGGGYAHITWVAQWFEDEGLMYCIARDASEKRQTLKQLKDSEENLANAQKIAKLGSWEFDLVNKVLYGSEQFFTMTGIPKEEVGTSLEEFYNTHHPHDKERLMKAFEAAISEQRPWDAEYRVIQPNGTVIHVHGRAEVIFDTDKRPIWLKGTIQDITIRKKLEQEREAVIQELTKSNADLKQFSFITSHNFRAPLSNIAGILSLLNFKSLDQYNIELIEMLKTSTFQLNKTIDDVTSILLIRNNVNKTINRVSLTDIYKKVEKVFSNALIESCGYIHTDFEVPHVTFNDSYLESILINLVSNAINFRSPERSLRICIKSVATGDGATTLLISDNGIGIDLQRHKSKIFGLYQRFHENTNGHGLGLFIIKSQINALGASIDVDSEIDRGTTFRITFKEPAVFSLHAGTENEIYSGVSHTVGQ